MSQPIVDEPKPAVPFLKWAGGKRQLMDEIRKHVPFSFGNYFEPFAGGAAVFYELRAAGRINHDAWLGDQNDELVTTYVRVRDDVDGVIEELRHHARKHSEEHYYKVRKLDGWTGSARAARMIYLNRTCFNGLYRVNRAGKFNTPMGKYVNPTICDEEGLRACAKALRRTEVVCSDFASLVTAARKGDFAYFDPPYVPVSETGDFTQFTPGGFNLADQQRLVDCARQLKDRGVHVLLSNADLPIVRKLYKGFERRKIEAKRNINSKGDRREPVGELLIW